MELLRGTLDLLLLKTLSGGALHGYAITQRLKEKTGEQIVVQEGVLYPALRKLEQRGWLESEWGYTETNREARFYRLTRAGRQALVAEESEWNAYVRAMTLALRRA
jgi:transcriptional regulator